MHRPLHQASARAVQIIEFERQLRGTLFLETNKLLVPAITLCESVGFVHMQRPVGPSHDVRADVYMEYRGMNQC